MTTAQQPSDRRANLDAELNDAALLARAWATGSIFARGFASWVLISSRYAVILIVSPIHKHRQHMNVLLAISTPHSDCSLACIQAGSLSVSALARWQQHCLRDQRSSSSAHGGSQPGAHLSPTRPWQMPTGSGLVMTMIDSSDVHADGGPAGVAMGRRPPDSIARRRDVIDWIETHMANGSGHQKK
eukprot:CAMPEP_0171233166 /NCGR_PEP_ID=MMETSP0790-20130122/40779_1 /TAXON_ID=2925 /ORGANISM="Alexandrium catenella, Strain OF101" /LENGTH=185 /DNA_ID=CAMNT_0011699415 /DNA_START=252 /DNA_END=805 /DNA_ORIENTATION=+